MGISVEAAAAAAFESSVHLLLKDGIKFLWGFAGATSEWALSHSGKPDTKVLHINILVDISSDKQVIAMLDQIAQFVDIIFRLDAQIIWEIDIVFRGLGDFVQSTNWRTLVPRLALCRASKGYVNNHHGAPLVMRLYAKQVYVIRLMKLRTSLELFGRMMCESISI